MKSYKDVKAQIAKLEKEAEGIRQRELKSVIAQVRRTIEQYELTPADLGLGAARKAASRKGRARTAARGRVSKGVAKYRDPASDKTWTGRGRPPTWMIGVKDPSAYLIGGAAAPVKAAAKKGRPGRKAAAKKTRAAAKPAKAAKTAKAVSRKRGRAASKSNGKSGGKSSAAPTNGGEATV